MSSDLEQLLVKQIVEAGLPYPKTQFSLTSTWLLTRHKPPRPRTWKIDFVWTRQRVCLEVQGGTWALMRHSRGKGYEADCEKANESVLQGWRMLRVTGDMVKDGRAIQFLHRALEGE